MNRMLQLIFLGIGCILIASALLLVVLETRRKGTLQEAEARLIGYIPASQTGKVYPRIEIEINGETKEISCSAASTTFVQTHIGEQVRVLISSSGADGRLSSSTFYLETGRPMDIPGLARVAFPVILFLFVGCNMLFYGAIIR